MKLNLDNVSVRLSLASEERTTLALRKEIANAIYQTGKRGLADVALSTKMWNGNADTDYTDEEVDYIMAFVESHFVPAVIVAVRESMEQLATPSPSTRRRTSSQDWRHTQRTATTPLPDTYGRHRHSNRCSS